MVLALDAHGKTKLRGAIYLVASTRRSGSVPILPLQRHRQKFHFFETTTIIAANDPQEVCSGIFLARVHVAQA